ncbi:hypothetical protein ACFPVT_09540 [Corynebacterium choanae]|uniref:Uncharacterized protein n=1 Tax=Corynebacterium choanae TaxID=1862358 RepID=A0A3G6J882_9CORY|nr:hypothetical protein [Corynebacterium choanae]AZA14267.1 hypothetical protein CCHOA_09420 [Corynebacterium choanae]
MTTSTASTIGSQYAQAIAMLQQSPLASYYRGPQVGVGQVETLLSHTAGFDPAAVGGAVRQTAKQAKSSKGKLGKAVDLLNMPLTIVSVLSNVIPKAAEFLHRLQGLGQADQSADEAEDALRQLEDLTVLQLKNFEHALTVVVPTLVTNAHVLYPYDQAAALEIYDNAVRLVDDIGQGIVAVLRARDESFAAVYEELLRVLEALLAAQRPGAAGQDKGSADANAAGECEPGKGQSDDEQPPADDKGPAHDKDCHCDGAEKDAPADHQPAPTTPQAGAPVAPTTPQAGTPAAPPAPPSNPPASQPATPPPPPAGAGSSTVPGTTTPQGVAPNPGQCPTPTSPSTAAEPNCADQANRGTSSDTGGKATTGGGLATQAAGNTPPATSGSGSSCGRGTGGVDQRGTAGQSAKTSDNTTTDCDPAKHGEASGDSKQTVNTTDGETPATSSSGQDQCDNAASPEHTAEAESTKDCEDDKPQKPDSPTGDSDAAKDHDDSSTDQQSSDKSDTAESGSSSGSSGSVFGGLLGGLGTVATEIFSTLFGSSDLTSIATKVIGTVGIGLLSTQLGGFIDMVNRQIHDAIEHFLPQPPAAAPEAPAPAPPPTQPAAAAPPAPAPAPAPAPPPPEPAAPQVHTKGIPQTPAAPPQPVCVAAPTSSPTEQIRKAGTW